MVVSEVVDNNNDGRYLVQIINKCLPQQIFWANWFSIKPGLIEDHTFCIVGVFVFPFIGWFLTHRFLLCVFSLSVPLAPTYILHVPTYLLALPIKVKSGVIPCFEKTWLFVKKKSIKLIYNWRRGKVSFPLCWDFPVNTNNTNCYSTLKLN